MSIMEPQTAAEAVANGAQLLDEKLPGWWRQIDLDTLNLSRCDLCVCGQLGSKMLHLAAGSPLTTYTTVMSRLDLKWLDSDAEYGFNVPMGMGLDADYRFQQLDAEWHKVIVARLEADALTTTEKKEMVLV